MDILGIGPLELIFILLIMLIVFSPNDLVKMAGNLGKFIRKFMTSSTWKAIQDTSKTIRNLPNKLAREAGLDELKQKYGEDLKQTKEEIKGVQDQLSSQVADLSAWTSSSSSNTQTIHPPEPSEVVQESDQTDESKE